MPLSVLINLAGIHHYNKEQSLKDEEMIYKDYVKVAVDKERGLRAIAVTGG
jgi:hypothetical protein